MAAANIMKLNRIKALDSLFLVLLLANYLNFNARVFQESLCDKCVCGTIDNCRAV